MRAFLRRYLGPPELATIEQTLAARTFHTVAWTTMLIASGFIVVLMLMQPESVPRRLNSLGYVNVLGLVLLQVNRRGATRLASWGLILGLAANVAQRAYTSGGLHAPAMPLFVALVLMAGLLLGERGGAIVAAVIVLALLLLAAVEMRGALPPPALRYSPLAMWLYYAMAIGFTLVLQRLISTALLRALRQAERELAERRERVKELKLLHAVARLLQRDRPFNRALLAELVALLPAAWQHPDCCEARIAYRDLEVTTPGWRESPWKQVGRFSTSDGDGTIEIVYLKQQPPAAEGPFLAEERSVLDSLAEMLVAYLELRQHQEELESLVAIRTRELSASYERLKAVEKMRDSLVHMVVHDMRTPLTIIEWALVGSQSGRKPAEQNPLATLGAALRCTQELTGMANDLLDVNKLEEGKLVLFREPCDLATLARDVANSLSGLEGDRPIVVEAAEHTEAACDAGIMRRVLQNLVSNGIKHTPPATPLRIAIAGREHLVRVSVFDEGPGVPPEARKKIFERFGAATTRTGTPYHSAGLGLAFCRLAVQAHGGCMGVCDGARGGSEFWFELPKQPGPIR